MMKTGCFTERGSADLFYCKYMCPVAEPDVDGPRHSTMGPEM